MRQLVGKSRVPPEVANSSKQLALKDDTEAGSWKRRGKVEATPCRNMARVSWWEATHCRRASALHTRLEAWAVRAGGESKG